MSLATSEPASVAATKTLSESQTNLTQWTALPYVIISTGAWKRKINFTSLLSTHKEINVTFVFDPNHSHSRNHHKPKKSTKATQWPDYP